MRAKTPGRSTLRCPKCGSTRTVLSRLGVRVRCEKCKHTWKPRRKK